MVSWRGIVVTTSFSAAPLDCGKYFFGGSAAQLTAVKCDRGKEAACLEYLSDVDPSLILTRCRHPILCRRFSLVHLRDRMLSLQSILKSCPHERSKQWMRGEWF